MSNAPDRYHRTDSTPSRRDVLRTTTAAASALALGTGVAAADQETGRFNDAPGRGGEAVVPKDDYRDASFVITDRTGDTAGDIEGVYFECNEGDGQPIFLVGWEFQYVESGETGTLYTRSNNVDTDLVYDWSDEGSKVCPNGGVVVPGESGAGDFVQVSYRATGPQ